MSRKDEIKRLIYKHTRRLQILKEQKAEFGSLYTPPHILTQIEDAQAEVEKLQQELEALEESGFSGGFSSSGMRETSQKAILQVIDDFLKLGGPTRMPKDQLIVRFEGYTMNEDLEILENAGYLKKTVDKFGGRSYIYLEITKKGRFFLENEV